MKLRCIPAVCLLADEEIPPERGGIPAPYAATLACLRLVAKVFYEVLAFAI